MQQQNNIQKKRKSKMKVNSLAKTNTIQIKIKIWKVQGKYRENTATNTIGKNDE